MLFPDQKAFKIASENAFEVSVHVFTVAYTCISYSIPCISMTSMPYHIPITYMGIPILYLQCTGIFSIYLVHKYGYTYTLENGIPSTCSQHFSLQQCMWLQGMMDLYPHTNIACILYQYAYGSHMFSQYIPLGDTIRYADGITYPYITPIFIPLYYYTCISGMECLGVVVL
jgi:hypothetical protein